MKVSSSPPRDFRLPLYVALGGILGAAYVCFDMISEARIREGTLTGGLAEAHGVVDHFFPVLVGALLGVCVHYVRLRSRLWAAERAAERAEVLRTRLQKVERDQAVWVLAAAVLHELNNPVHAVGLLLDEVDACGADGPRRDELIERARAQVDRARGHLQTLRAMRAEGEPEMQGVSLAGIVRALADDLGRLAAEEGLRVESHCDPAVEANADPTYVRTILENLIGNALASLREGGGGRVTIRLSAEGGRAVVSVADDGPPMAASVHRVLFEPLRSTKTNGLGLGLPIARALARAMRGDVSLDAHDRKTFRLELPLREGP